MDRASLYLLELTCEVLMPCAVASQITAVNAPQVRANVVAEGANGPLTPEADEINARLHQLLVRSFNQVLGVAQEKEVPLRTAADILAIQRVAEAMLIHGIYNTPY